MVELTFAEGPFPSPRIDQIRRQVQTPNFS